MKKREKIIRETRELIKQLKKFNLPKGRFLIYGSGVLGIRGLREMNDLDVIVEASFYKKLLKKYREYLKENPKALANNGRTIKIGRFELGVSPPYLNFKKAKKEADVFFGIKFVSLRDLIFCKKKMKRKKDLRDIQIIKKFVEGLKIFPKKSKKGVFLVVKDEKKTVGICFLRAENEVGELKISIKKEYRGIGLGKRLLREALKRAKKELKLKILRVFLSPKDKISQDFFQKFGFKKVAKVSKKSKKEGKFSREILMIKKL